MAPKQGPNKPATVDFGLEGINDAFQRQSNLQMARQDTEQNFQQVSTAALSQKSKIADSSAKITENLLSSFADLAGIANENAAAAKLQRDRFTSGNPMDSIEAIGDQILDPSKYTAAGRQKRLQEQQQLANVQVSVASAQQSALSALSQKIDADLAVAGAPLAQAKLNEQQGMERIQTEQLAKASQAQELSRNTQMQQLALANLDSTQIKALKDKAQGQPIDVGGVLIQPGLLEERTQQMDDRDYQTQVRENALASSNAQLAKIANRKVLETYSLEELRPMLQSGDPTGQFELNDIQQIYGIKQQAQSDQIARTSQALQLGDFMQSTILPTDDQVKTMQQTVPAGTPLAASVAALDTVNQTAAAMFDKYHKAGVPVPLEVGIMANDAIQKQKEQLDKDIDKQATLAAKGDSNMKELYSQRYRGNPLPQATVQSAIQDRLEKNQPLSDILPKEIGDDVQRRYRDKVQKLTADSKIGGFGVSDKKTIQAQAMSEAIDESMQQATQVRTAGLLTDQLMIPGNPLNGKVSKGAFLDMVSKADQEGRQALQGQLQLTDEEMAKVQAGEIIPGKTNRDMRTDLALIQNTQLFFKLDTQEAGLAQKYAAWWNLQGDDYIKNRVAGNVQGAASKDLQSQAFESYASPVEQQGSQSYKSSIEASQDYYGQAKDEKYQQLVTFDSNPTYRQAVLLQMDKELTNPEKTQFMKNFVNPIVDLAKKDGKDYNETNKMIEQALDMGVAPDPTTQKILNKVVKSRPTINSQLDAMTTNPWWSASIASGFGNATDFQITQRTRGDEYGWFKDLMKTGQTPPSSTQSSTPGSTGLGSSIGGIMSAITGDFRNNMQATDQSLGKPSQGVGAK